ncbi:Dihydrofolate synthase/folylpolyglutamate synthase [Buchnera aphidicola (Eriosoma grossulariae)]|uniref:bifunctional tetrahydrofolate synthase/dihydrofolate synthase n=1 Tax=Buchnera aphidicola TaxID=9 RepID=UPI00346419AF
MHQNIIRNFHLDKEKILSLWLLELENQCKDIYTTSLCNIKLVANKLQLLDQESFIFIVTGTNGKGTTCLVLEQLLIYSGYRVGLYTSPHLIKYIERVRINGKYLSPLEHILAFSEIEFEKNNIALTYFEFITLSALFLFKKERLDVLILEVGIGGRLDATNIINADVSIITNIAIDHAQLLGCDRESIGFEKSDIFRNKKIAIIGDKNIPHSVYNTVKERNVILKKIGHDWKWKVNDNSWDFFSKNDCFTDLPFPKVSLTNVVTAIAALCYSGLYFSKNNIKNVIKNLWLPGRFHIIYKNPLVILDVCHNPHAAIHLSQKLLKIKKNKVIHSVLAILKDKDIDGFLSPLLPLVNFWYCASLDHPRSALGKNLIKYLPNSAKLFQNIPDAFVDAFYNACQDDIILVLGSFMTVSEILFFIENEQFFKTEHLKI